MSEPESEKRKYERWESLNEHQALLLPRIEQYERHKYLMRLGWSNSHPGYVNPDAKEKKPYTKSVRESGLYGFKDYLGED